MEEFNFNFFQNWCIWIDAYVYVSMQVWIVVSFFSIGRMKKWPTKLILQKYATHWAVIMNTPYGLAQKVCYW